MIEIIVSVICLAIMGCCVINMIYLVCKQTREHNAFWKKYNAEHPR